MNRHTSNPFLSDWDDEPTNNLANDANSAAIDANNNQRSSTFTRRSSSGQAEFGMSRPGLYRRNMSSFEAASLQLEQQQQMQENGSIINTQKDLIAQMTADFQSVIETNDKQFENLEGFNPFDPFETIVDDDVSLPSPAPDKLQHPDGANELKSADQNLQDTAERPDCMDMEGKRARTNAHDSIDDDDAELVSTPVRNIKSSQICSDTNKSPQEIHDENNHSSTGGADLNGDSKPTYSRDTDSIAKASLFASLLASAEATSQQGIEGLGATETDGDIDLGNNESPTNHMENPTHVIKGSPNSAGDHGSLDRPVSFFDPFETVIDKDALTSLMNDTQQQQRPLSDGSTDENNTTRTQMRLSDERDEQGLHDNPNQLKSGSQVTESASIETVFENDTSARLQGHDDDNDKVSEEPNKSAEHQADQRAAASSTKTDDQTNPASATSRPTGRTIKLDGVAPPPVTPSRRFKPQKQQKPRNEDDSSDSSDEDDRIQIVIKARDASKLDSSGPTPIVPLLPPPPSKSTIRQTRERGQVEDMPSPMMSYKTRERKLSSSSSSGPDEEEDREKENRTKSVEIASKPGDPAIDDYPEEEGGDEDDGQFVIPMKHSDDEGDNYGKPDTPLYDDDTSYVLEDFPAKYEGPGWEMMLRYPPKKKLTSNRFWKKIFVKIAQVPLVPEAGSKAKQQSQTNDESQTCWALQIFDKPEDKKPLQEIPIQATYTVSEISSQLFDQFGKIFTIKLQYIFYKERVGVRQGQLARFIHTGHIGTSTTSGGHGADPISIGAIKRLGAPIEHSPQISQIIKLGCTSYEDVKQFKECLEDCLFKMPIHRDRALSTYKTEEVQMAVRDETYIELNQIGTITRQMARVRLFFLSFLNGTPTIEVGINDIHRQGREVVGRMDILPVVTEEWIRLEACELHDTVDKAEFENPDSRIIKLVPPDATFFELMRFRVRPPRNRELPLQISANMSVTRTKVSINCEVMVPGCVSRKHGQIPCENISIKIRIPECWIYFFREEKHFRMGSKKSVNRRPGKVKGIERFLGGSGLQDFNDDSSLIEVTSGQAKYEHHHNSIVWRAVRWPKESQSAYVQNNMKIRLPLTAYDKMPDNFYEYVHVEYTMPATTVSHTTLRSISMNPCDDEPPEKYVKYSAKYEYKVKMRLSVNLGNRPGGSAEPESSPIVIMKQPDLHGDLQREEDSDDDQSDDEVASS